MTEKPNRFHRTAKENEDQILGMAWYDFFMSDTILVSGVCLYWYQSAICQSCRGHSVPVYNMSHKAEHLGWGIRSDRLQLGNFNQYLTETDPECRIESSIINAAHELLQFCLTFVFKNKRLHKHVPVHFWMVINKDVRLKPEEWTLTLMLLCSTNWFSAPHWCINNCSSSSSSITSSNKWNQ